MVRGSIALIALLTVGCSTGWMTRLDNDPAADEGAFVGGRGLIAAEGPAGMFINPTSGTSPKGTVTAQTCVAVVEPKGGGTAVGNGILATYAVKDWLEVGAVTTDIQNDGHGLSVGPHVRARLLKDEPGSIRPEAAVGYYSTEGRVGNRSVFAAFSKGRRFGADKERPILRSGRLHAGVRQTWRDAGADDVVGYFGAEVGLPAHTYLVGEIQTDETAAAHTKFGFGLQARHPSGIGVTIGGFQPGGSSDIALYIGIGIGFSW